NKETVWERYHADKHHLSICCFNDSDTPTARISEKDNQLIETLRKETPHYRKLDKSVLMSRRQVYWRGGSFEPYLPSTHRGWRMMRL
ncbi:MAG: hypothetical protein CL996_07985, partial [Euryarchaeota archaeon]|nr:hypothetical protein [Euryarchaeota archaeon]